MWRDQSRRCYWDDHIVLKRDDLVRVSGPMPASIGAARDGESYAPKAYFMSGVPMTKLPGQWHRGHEGGRTTAYPVQPYGGKRQDLHSQFDRIADDDK